MSRSLNPHWRNLNYGTIFGHCIFNMHNCLDWYWGKAKTNLERLLILLILVGACNSRKINQFNLKTLKYENVGLCLLMNAPCLFHLQHVPLWFFQGCQSIWIFINIRSPSVNLVVFAAVTDVSRCVAIVAKCQLPVSWRNLKIYVFFNLWFSDISADAKSTPS